MECKEDGCNKPVHGWGWCQRHYDEFHATPLRRSECALCGGPKPAGLGRKICDTCKPLAAELRRAKIKEYQHQRYLANRDEILERERVLRTDPEARKQKREYLKRWRENNPENARLVSRRSRIKRKYGLTVEEYDAILARGCAICGTHDGRVVGKRNGWDPPPARLCLDHSHADGAIRDALCHSCNIGLGSFRDDPGLLGAAIKYLKRHAPQ